MRTIRNLTTLLLLTGTIPTAFATPLPKESIENFVKGFVPGCLVQQRKEPLSKYMTESQLNEYCYCTANRATDFITFEDMVRFFQTKSGEHMRPSIEAAGNYCIQVLVKKWGYSY